MWSTRNCIEKTQSRTNQNYYCLNTVTYGTTPAFFLATKCLSELGHQLKASNPIAAQAILSDFYLITGVDSIVKLVKIHEAIHNTFFAASLQHWKYMAKQPSILTTANSADIADTNFLQFWNNLQSISILWAIWNQGRHMTRRVILYASRKVQNVENVENFHKPKKTVKNCSRAHLTIF